METQNWQRTEGNKGYKEEKSRDKEKLLIAERGHTWNRQKQNKRKRTKKRSNPSLDRKGSKPGFETHAYNIFFLNK